MRGARVVPTVGRGDRDDRGRGAAEREGSPREACRQAEGSYPAHDLLAGDEDDVYRSPVGIVRAAIQQCACCALGTCY